MDCKALGASIRFRRKQLDLTQQELAKRCSITKSMLSKIETGTVMPSLGTLSHIADELDIPLPELLNCQSDTNIQINAGTDIYTSLVSVSKGCFTVPLAPSIKNKKIQPFYYEIHKSEERLPHSAHSGDEFYYVIEGEMLLHFESQDYHLKSGDSAYFHATYDHQTIPLTDVVRLIDILI